MKKQVLVLGLTLLSPMLASGQVDKKEKDNLSEIVVVATRIPEVKQNSATSMYLSMVFPSLHRSDYQVVTLDQ